MVFVGNTTDLFIYESKQVFLNFFIKYLFSFLIVLVGIFVIFLLLINRIVNWENKKNETREKFGIFKLV